MTEFSNPTGSCDKFYCNDVQQMYDDSCAIRSQQLILNSIGIDISEDQLRIEAYQNGWYEPGVGTPMQHIGNLIEAHGLHVERKIGGTIDDLRFETAQGHNVIVGVDSGELWHKGIDETFEDIIQGQQADHALLVSGFAINPLTGNEDVLLTDPGTGELYADYPVDQFEDAWDDSGNFMVSLIDDF